MIKNSFSPEGIYTLCDRCRKIIVTDFNYLTGTITWETLTTPRKGSHPHTKRMDFCDYKCRIVYLRGRKYWRRKQMYIFNSQCDMALGTHGR